MEGLSDQFSHYVHQLTGRTVVWDLRVRKALPGYLGQRYAPHELLVDGQRWLAIELKQAPPPPMELSKQLAQLASRLDVDPTRLCLVAEQLPPYLRRRLVELGQAFVIPGRQLFWPALGSAETQQRPHRLQPAPVSQLSPVAQQLLIALLLSRLSTPVTVTSAAGALGYAPTSMSRAIKELEASALIRIEARGKERAVFLKAEPSAIWQRAQAMLRIGLRSVVRVLQKELPSWVRLFAGESALAAATDLAAPNEAVFAVSSREWTKKAMGIEAIPVSDAGTCQVELWRYAPEPTAAEGTVDPLSLLLSLRDLTDERLQMALDQLMERLPW